MPSPIAQSLELLTSQRSLPSELIEQVIVSMLSGDCSQDEMVAFLTALQQKGETVDELVGAAKAMRRSMVRIHSDFPVILDTCGTGGDGSQTFNISTAAAIVIAAAGVAVAKHGNRKITSSTGSADVLSELGIHLDAPPSVVERCLNELGICFCFAPRFHPAMQHVGAARRAVSGPTIFNRLGPLCNPAGANRQVLGVGSADLQPKLAAALLQLGTERSIVVRGEDGVDEVSLEAPTCVLQIESSRIEKLAWLPSDFGISQHPRSALFADSPASSAACIREALSGRAGACRDAVVINAAAGLWLAGKEPTLARAANAAAYAIDSGKAASLIESLAALSHTN